jgi:hypothetical protein
MLGLVSAATLLRQPELDWGLLRGFYSGDSGTAGQNGFGPCSAGSRAAVFSTTKGRPGSTQVDYV